MRHPVAGLLAILLLSACGSGPAPSVSPTGAATATATATPATAPTPTLPLPSPTPLASLALDESIKLDPTRVLQVCHGTFELQSWPMLLCGDVIEVALQALGADAIRVMRAEFRFACKGGLCTGGSPDVGYVVVSGATWASEVTVQRGSDGGLAPTTIRAVEPPAPQPFTPPAVARPVVLGAPKAVAARKPYPLCGDETAPMHGPFDQAARICFSNGVLAGARVEFVARSRGLEGEPTVMIYRFDGSGGLLTYGSDNGSWMSFRGGISDGAGDRVFDQGGLQTMAVEVH